MWLWEVSWEEGRANKRYIDKRNAVIGNWGSIKLGTVRDSKE